MRAKAIRRMETEINTLIGSVDGFQDTSHEQVEQLTLALHAMLDHACGLTSTEATIKRLQKCARKSVHLDAQEAGESL